MLRADHVASGSGPSPPRGRTVRLSLRSRTAHPYHIRWTAERGSILCANRDEDLARPTLSAHVTSFKALPRDPIRLQ